MRTVSLLSISRHPFVKFSLIAVVVLFQQACKKGEKGDPGTANVYHSEWFTPSSYTKNTVFGITEFSFDQTAPDITKGILDSGTVITYAKLAGYSTSVWPAGQVAAMPVQVVYTSGINATTDTWSALITEGHLRIRFVNDRNIYSSIANTHSFRYVIIPGGKNAGLGMSLDNMTTIQQNASIREVAENYDKMSYEEVCRKLNVAE